MKKILTFFLAGAAIAALGAAFTACESGGDSRSLVLGQSYPVQLIEKETLPEWLIEKVDFFEANQDGMRDVNIYKGEFDGRGIVYIHNIYDSCIGCQFYDWETGGPPKGKGNTWEDSKNWVIIYQIIGLGILS